MNKLVQGKVSRQVEESLYEADHVKVLLQVNNGHLVKLAGKIHSQVQEFRKMHDCLQRLPSGVGVVGGYIGMNVYKDEMQEVLKPLLDNNELSFIHLDRKAQVGMHAPASKKPRI